MDKKRIAQFSDILRDQFSEETTKRAAYYDILPDSIQCVDDEFEDSIVIGVSDKNNGKGITIGKATLNQRTNQISQTTDSHIIPQLRRQIDSGLYIQTEVE